MFCPHWGPYQLEENKCKHAVKMMMQLVCKSHRGDGLDGSRGSVEGRDGWGGVIWDEYQGYVRRIKWLGRLFLDGSGWWSTGSFRHEIQPADCLNKKFVLNPADQLLKEVKTDTVSLGFKTKIMVFVSIPQKFK